MYSPALAFIAAVAPSTSPSAISEAGPTGVSLFVAFLGALGVGSLLGSLATSVFGYINGRQERRHQQQLREQDRKHEAVMAEMEFRNRLEEQRRRDLREGLASVVNAVLDMERWLQFVEWPDDKSQEEAARVLLRARGEFVKARAGLLLDQDAEKIVRATSTLSIDSDRYRGMLIDRRQMVAQAQLGTNPQTVLDLAQQIKETKESILRQIQAVITDARSVLDRRYGSQPTSMQPAASAPS